MKPTAASFLLGLVLGGAVALAGATALLSGGAGNASVEAAQPGGPGVRAQRDAAATNLAMPEPGGRRTGAAAASTTRLGADVDPARVRALVDAAGDVAIEPVDGSGAIWGHVRDAEGVGQAGVVLRAQGREPSSGAGSPADVGQAPPPVDALEDVVRSSVERYRQSRARLYETTTGPDGAYRFEGLPEGDWDVQAYKRDWVVEPYGGRSRRVPTGSELDFEAAPVVALPIDVVRPDGSRSPSAVIRCDGGDEREQVYAWSPDAPSLRLAPGHWELTALAGIVEGARGDDYELRSEPQEVDLVAGVSPAPLRLQLEGRVGIRGRVRLPNDGVTGINPRVHLQRLGWNSEPDLAALAESDQSTWVGGGSEFSFLDLEDGRYVVGVSRTWSAGICAHAVVDVAGAIARCDLEIPPIDLSRTLVATVTDPDGRTLAGVDFSFEWESGNSRNNSGIQAMRLGDGRYAIPLDQEFHEAYFSSPRAEDRFRLEARHDDHGRKQVDLQAGQTEVAVSFAVPARLEVTVNGYSGSSVEGRILLSLERAGGDQRWRGFGWESLPPDGVQVFDAVEPGSYQVRMMLSERGSTRRSFGGMKSILSQPVELVAGDNTLSLAVPLLYEVVVSYPEAEDGARMQLSGDDGMFGFGGSMAQVDDQGRAVFADVPAGRYTLSCWSPHGQMEIDVPCGVVTFEAQVMDALRVSITEADGALASAGLRDGDLVVAVNGEEFTSQQDFFLLYRKTSDFTLSVLRGRERIDLAIEQIDWMDPMNLGGSLTPASR